MTALALFQALSARDVALMPYPDGTLRYKAPKGMVTPELSDELRQQKSGLHDLVEAFEERAAIAEYCGGLSQREAEHLAWHSVRGETPAQLFVAAVPA